MENIDNRAERRRKTCVQAFVTDQHDTFDIKCMIRDVSAGGCMIVTSHLHELPDQIQLIPEGFKRPVMGKIVWRKGKTAGVTFIDPSVNPELDDIDNQHDPLNAGEVEEDTFVLEAFVKPAGYSDRLSRY
ncbi:MAG: PilZ domain-containing protein [Hyphomicrobiaceae bacterium]|nr:PilZ domain-containing protein [Hyphomicrobiaceae bacterium]